MSKILNISEATALALHAVVYLEAHKNRKVPTREIAEAFHASEAHLSKVMQRLVRAGLVDSVRGPKGGFEVGKPTEKVSLLQLFEIFEGPVSGTTCLFGGTFCELDNCVIGDLLSTVNNQVIEYMSKTSLKNIAKTYIQEREASLVKKNR